MRSTDVGRAAAEAVAANPNRPATAIIHDSADVRLLVFRLAPGQSVAPHRNASTVTLTAISGRGFASGDDGERPMQPREIVIFEPNEMHSMRADTEEFVLLATITPRPGNRARQTRDDDGPQ